MTIKRSTLTALYYIIGVPQMKTIKWIIQVQQYSMKIFALNTYLKSSLYVEHTANTNARRHKFYKSIEK